MTMTLDQIKQSTFFYSRYCGIDATNLQELQACFPLYNLHCRQAWLTLLEDLKAQVDSKDVANDYCNYKGYALQATSSNPYFSELYKLCLEGWTRVGTLRYDTCQRIWKVEDEQGILCCNQSLKSVLDSISHGWTNDDF